MSAAGSATDGCSFCFGDTESRSGVNRIYRLYRDEGLSVRKRKARRRAVRTRAPIFIEAKANARWSLDFVHDQFACGRRFRILDVVDMSRANAWRQSRTHQSLIVVSRGN
jgi:hypothetical protein